MSLLSCFLLLQCLTASNRPRCVTMQTAVLRSAKRAVRGGCGPVSGEFGDLGSPAPFCFVRALGFRVVWTRHLCGYCSSRFRVPPSIGSGIPPRGGALRVRGGR